MASVPEMRPAIHPWWEDAEHAEFTGHFSAEQRAGLMGDDRFAWRTVSLLLVSIVLGGATLMALTVLWTVL
jgi:hypothetical protein